MEPIETVNASQGDLGIFCIAVSVSIVKNQNPVPALLWYAILFELRAFGRHRVLDYPRKVGLHLPFPFGAREPFFRHVFLLDYAGFLDGEFSPVDMQPKIRGVVFPFPLNPNVFVAAPFEVPDERIDRNTFVVNSISLQQWVCPWSPL
jgi:hypothetical protein